MEELKLPKSKSELLDFAEKLKELDRIIGFKVSSRGWCYILEQRGLITKAEFDLIENIINNRLRKKGILPIDFVAEEEARKFSGVEIPETQTPIAYMKSWLDAVLDAGKYYTPDWWKGEKYYIQMVVEKIDLKTLFEPVCKKYHIPIATSKGWSSIIQRGEYARRFKEAEESGLICVLLYCGDHDPDGLRISDFLRKNLRDLKNIEWSDGFGGYDPKSLDIKRFGLDYDFIIKYKLSWINNLITGSGKNLADPSHKNYRMPYVQNYIKKIGIRKCEANALVVNPEAGKKLCRDTIIRYLGDDALDRFQRKREKIIKMIDDFCKKTGLKRAIEDALNLIIEEE